MKISATTTICAVIGNPIEHTLSPAMHNVAYRKLGINYAYVAFKVTNVEQAIRGIKALGIKGVSVTVPHKIAVIPYLDQVEGVARSIGAVNTITNVRGKLVGANTDAEGALHALGEKTSIKRKNVVLIGSGGTARAIAFGLRNEDANVTILNRTAKRAKELAQETGAAAGSLKDMDIVKKSDILINATTVGMEPNMEESIVAKDFLHKDLIVFDIVYNPKNTRLIRDAKAKGCTIVYGYKMLLHQAAGQFIRFTGYEPPIAVMEKELLSSLSS